MYFSTFRFDVLNRIKILDHFAGHTLGILALAVTVVLWTTSNFLASTILSNDTFAKPFFITYVNTAAFSILLVFKVFWYVGEYIRKSTACFGSQVRHYSPLLSSEDGSSSTSRASETSEGEDICSPSSSLPDGNTGHVQRGINQPTIVTSKRLGLHETFVLSLEFCAIWFAANFAQAKGLEYTTVASATILMSTSGVWTLLFGYVVKTERFTLKKVLGVIASLIGTALVSFMDISEGGVEGHGSLPQKTTSEIAIGDLLALGSAILYGVYTILMKTRLKDETNVDVVLFLGFVGLINMLFFWPGFFFLQLLAVEKFELPPTEHVWSIILWNALISVVSDLSWAYAVLLTSPLIVTVGLSLSIPLSIAGQALLHSQSFGILYWFGAFTVFVAFLLVNAQGTGTENGVVERRERQTPDSHSARHLQ